VNALWSIFIVVIQLPFIFNISFLLLVQYIIITIMFSARFARSFSVLRNTRSLVFCQQSANSLRFLSAAADSSTQMSPESLYETFSSSNTTGNAISDAMYSLYTADAVCFDVDSTVIAEEGIDVLAAYLGKGDAVAELTKSAMDGNTKFQDALAARLALMEPGKQQILECLKAHPLELSPGVDALMKSLQAKSVDIWLVSGGFRIMIEPVAKSLKIPISNIVANTILFDEAGNYNGFDSEEPTSRDMGKPKALEQIRAQKGYETMVMVGDGATDAQAKPPAKAFIGFGGVVQRQAVKEKADWFVTDFDDMTKIVELRE
jgi:phosphoserine phosphatase